MANVGFPPANWDKGAAGHFLTFIVPSLDGCNLRCSFCFVRQRREITETLLAPEDYTTFICMIAKSASLAGIAIQGYEPLLSSALPYTTAILRTSRELGVPASIVTNGTFLADALTDLSDCMPNRIGVSLDAATPERHDRLRGLRGAWSNTVRGIECFLRETSSHGSSLTAISVLFPGKRSDLLAMPALLSALGIKEWIVNPVMKVGRGTDNIFPGNLQQSVEALKELTATADQHSVRLKVGDELGLFARNAELAKVGGLQQLDFCTLPKGIRLSRLVASGQLSVGTDVTRTMPPGSPRWTPGLDPADILRRV